MRRWHLFLLVVLTVVAAGCASHYQLSLSNGTNVIAATKPKLDGRGYYVFTDLEGNERRIFAAKVRVIEPAR